MSLRDPEFIESLEGFYSTSELKVSERLPSHTVRLNPPQRRPVDEVAYISS